MGGDWYDFIPMDAGRWGLVMADVSGKGTAAALLMSATRGILRSLAEAACTPREVLAKLNRLLVQDFPAGRFVTMVYAVLDPAKRTVTFANAGHCRPLLMTDTSAQFLEVERGIPLGLGPGDFRRRKWICLSVLGWFFTAMVLPRRKIRRPTNMDWRVCNSIFRERTPPPRACWMTVRSFANGSGLRDDASVILVLG